ncbi:DUF2071 domain-containing protein [Glaciihabitans arcticus]|uniref:DUF2071 domain-containing protein n=1 Tax=Glaciihabitans arcticus TaxID=2668039 RepID=A0A4V2JET5_9MICO|nr:DUF2071 domain-containing protein [Glaciihabitans arcticus]TBN56799.1 DUF2071 domain-containing protein [Glaciihabitans arcticus]
MTDAAAQPLSAVAPPLAGGSSSSQRWSDLAFLHWRVAASLVQPLLPPGLRPDEFDGSSWVGLIPFRLDRARVFGSPPVPYFGNFVEVNVRLYAVDAAGRRGVVFVSLEASRLAAVLAARALFSIPYVWSSTRVQREGDAYRYTARRHLARDVGCDILVTPSAVPVVGDPLADFLTARWGLFTARGGRTLFLPNEHPPWPLFEAQLQALDDTLLASAGFDGLVDRAPDSVLWSPGVTTRFGTPQAAG